MNHSGAGLSDFFRTYRARSEPLVLATLARTLGSTYRKAGAQMLIAHDGAAAGLLSGGCLEADLLERARAVLATGAAASIEYDTRTSDDLIWGIGLGCEGAMTILLTRLDAANDYQPFAYAEQCRTHATTGRFAIVIASTNPQYAIGSVALADDHCVVPPLVRQALQTEVAQERSGDKRQTATPLETEGATHLIVSVDQPTRLLLLGAGPDAMPLVDVAGLMGWHVTVTDHRPAYAVAARFPRARAVLSRPAAELTQTLASAQFDAAVVMSHHLLSDQIYLAQLAASSIGYIGLLGPAPRRMRLLAEVGAKSALLGNRLYGPIGLDIGAVSPETIALAIVAEIHAVLSGRRGGSFSRA